MLLRRPLHFPRPKHTAWSCGGQFLKPRALQVDFRLGIGAGPSNYKVLHPVWPCALPPRAMLGQLYEDFRVNYRNFEKWNISQRVRVLDCRLAQSRDLLFRQLRAPAPDQVDTVTVHRTYTVLAAEPSSHQVHLDSSLDLRGSSTWKLNGVSVSISGCDDVTCTISGEVLLESEAELEQVQVLASPSDIHSEFVSLWPPRWQKHAAVSDTAWQRVMDFAKAFLPSFRFELPPLTVSMWLGAVRRYKPRAARGPDGIAKLDLLNLPDSCTRQLLELLVDVEVGRDDWPQQLLTGLVCLLSKGNKRLDAEGYRPICLFSMVYRTWAGLRARQMLCQLTQHMDFEAFGFLPGHEATELWYSAQAEVELCCQGGQELLGFSSHLVKAFNNLPRVPLRHVALHLGFPMTLIRPWLAFLAGVQRRFHVRQCVSRPFCQHPASRRAAHLALWLWWWLIGLIMLTCISSLPLPAL